MKKNSMREKFESNKLPKKEISDVLKILSDADNKKKHRVSERSVTDRLTHVKSTC